MFYYYLAGVGGVPAAAAAPMAARVILTEQIIAFFEVSI